jgi:hypothetical protein
MKFLEELITRITSKSPAFFVIIQKLSVITVIVAGIPALIAKFQSDLGISLPPWILATASKAVAISAIVAWIIAKLPLKTTQVPDLPITNK